MSSPRASRVLADASRSRGSGIQAASAAAAAVERRGGIRGRDTAAAIVSRLYAGTYARSKVTEPRSFRSPCRSAGPRCMPSRWRKCNRHRRTACRRRSSWTRYRHIGRQCIRSRTNTQSSNRSRSCHTRASRNRSALARRYCPGRCNRESRTKSPRCSDRCTRFGTTKLRSPGSSIAVRSGRGYRPHWSRIHSTHCTRTCSSRPVHRVPHHPRGRSTGRRFRSRRRESTPGRLDAGS